MPVLYVEVPDSLWSEIHFPSSAMLTDAPWGALLKSAVVVAVVASAETLLCATAVDQTEPLDVLRVDAQCALGIRLAPARVTLDRVRRVGATLGRGQQERELAGAAGSFLRGPGKDTWE